MKTAQDITLDLLKNNSVVINPIEEIVERANKMRELGRLLNNGPGSAPDKTTVSFFEAQEKEINAIKQTYYHYVVQSGLADAQTGKGNIFDQFDFALVISKKEKNP
jgi:hypothetical protein